MAGRIQSEVEGKEMKKKKMSFEERVMNNIGWDGRPQWYRRDGTPYTGPNAMVESSADLGNFEYKVVKQEFLWWGAWLSTVWLGLDHRWGKGPPLIFETMLFTPFQYPSFIYGEKVHIFRGELDCERYSTEEEAIEGHAQMKKNWSRIDRAFIYFFKSLWNSIYQSLRTLTPIYLQRGLTALLGRSSSNKILTLLHCMPKSLSDRLNESRSLRASGDTETEKKTSTT
jgi:hypothetical protein